MNWAAASLLWLIDWLAVTCCFRMFVVQAIPDSNLVLVVTQADCDCSRQYGPILLEPKEIKYILQTDRRSCSAPCWTRLCPVTSCHDRSPAEILCQRCHDRFIIIWSNSLFLWNKEMIRFSNRLSLVSKWTKSERSNFRFVLIYDWNWTFKCSWRLWGQRPADIVSERLTLKTGLHWIYQTILLLISTKYYLRITLIFLNDTLICNTIISHSSCSPCDVTFGRCVHPLLCFPWRQWT